MTLAPPSPPARGDAVTPILTAVGLDPETATWSRRPHATADSWLVLPSPRRPRLLVPCAPGGADLVRHRLADGVRARIARRAAVAALGRSGAALPLLRLRIDDRRVAELKEWLAPGLGVASLGVLLGPPRANRKPVLVVLDASGRPHCYAKVGGTALTRALVQGEAEHLHRVAGLGLQRVRAPRVLRAGSWNGLDVLVTSALTAPASGRHPTTLPVEATRDLLRRLVRVDVPLAHAPFLHPGLFTAPTPPGLPTLERLRTRLLDAVGDRRLPLAASHGDWTPWNMAVADDGTLDTWDWERFSVDTAQGLDVVHFCASAVDHEDPGRAEQLLVRDLPRLLAACGVDPRLSRPLLCAYLLHLAGRYSRDLELEPACDVERRMRWATRLLVDQITLLEHEETT
jgi:hypothetical protein